jgi:hypothetical protein
MTAEVVVINKYGIAMAADSAVTIGGQKTYNSAVKLFSLSKTAPVGIMIYGSDNLSSTPWEIIIKQYRKQIGSTTFALLDDYARGFINFLQAAKYSNSQERTEQMFFQIARYIKVLHAEIDNMIQVFEVKEPEIRSDSHRLHEITIAQINDTFEALESLPFIDGTDQSKFDSLKDKLTEKLEPFIKGLFGNLLPQEPAHFERLLDIATLFTVKPMDADLSSGIVIAGYGEDQIYPAVTSYEISGYTGDHLRYYPITDKSCDINSARKARIFAFAQSDMIDLFVHGMNRQTQGYLEAYSNYMFKNIREESNKTSLVAAEKKIFNENIDFIHQKMQTDHDNYVLKENVSPVMDMLGLLPKDELANMAETLINLTAFKRKMTASIESVGGPVDVAVISKGDGLVWMKRKHYFPKELNMSFYNNYYRGIDDES